MSMRQIIIEDTCYISSEVHINLGATCHSSRVGIKIDIGLGFKLSSCVFLIKSMPGPSYI